MLVAQSCPTLCDPMERSPPGSPVHGTLQTRILEWVAIPFSRESSWPRARIRVSCTKGRFFPSLWDALFLFSSDINLFLFFQYCYNLKKKEVIFSILFLGMWWRSRRWMPVFHLSFFYNTLYRVIFTILFCLSPNPFMDIFPGTKFWQGLFIMVLVSTIQPLQIIFMENV